MSPIEALADAIMQFEGWKKGSRSWRNRNPGNLRTYQKLKDVPTDNAGYRIFPSLSDGFGALVSDLTAKFTGTTGTNLTEQSSLLDLLSVYSPVGDMNNPTEYTKFVCGWTAQALGRAITANMTLKEYLGT
jgi:hypothetical protein